MKWTITIIDSSAGRGEGTIEVTGDRFEVRKKSALVRAAFGVIGSALTSGKEIMSFSQQDIAACEEEAHTFSTDLKVTLTDGSSIKLRASKGNASEIRQAMGR